jgi:hypothetical protein
LHADEAARHCSCRRGGATACLRRRECAYGAERAMNVVLHVAKHPRGGDFSAGDGCRGCGREEGPLRL